jgi:hypothetical protein
MIEGMNIASGNGDSYLAKGGQTSSASWIARRNEVK